MQRRGLIEGLLLTVLVLALLWPVDARLLTPFIRAVLDGCHFPVFFVATMLIYRCLSRDRSSRKRAIFAFVSGLLLAGVVEGAQSIFGRQPSGEDFLRGAAGATMGVLGSALAGGKRKWRRAHFLAVLVFAIWSFLPATRLWRVERWQDRRFPMLADFENPFELLLWSPQGGDETRGTVVARSKAFAGNGEHSLLVSTGAGGYAGVAYRAGGQDWSGHSMLVWEMRNEGEPFTLGIRIDDDGDVSKADGRYASSVEAGTGTGVHRIPLEEVRTGPETRELNLGSVSRIVFYTDLDAPARVFHLDAVRLE